MRRSALSSGWNREIKLFRFQRREAAFEDLAPEEQQEEISEY